MLPAVLKCIGREILRTWPLMAIVIAICLVVIQWPRIILPFVHGGFLAWNQRVTDEDKQRFRIVAVVLTVLSFAGLAAFSCWEGMR